MTRISSLVILVSNRRKWCMLSRRIGCVGG